MESEIKVKEKEICLTPNMFDANILFSDLTPMLGKHQSLPFPLTTLAYALPLRFPFHSTTQNTCVIKINILKFAMQHNEGRLLGRFIS